MSETTRDQLLDHEYDGIREYDNPTPGWWHVIFLGSIVFSLFYWAFWEWSPLAPTIQQALAARETAELQKQFAEIGQLAPDEPTILRMMGEPKWMTVAQSIFKANCVSCHGAQGQGEIGPNMTDDSYKNVKTLADIPRVIEEGANNGAMPAWKNRLQTNEIVLVAAYVASLRGENLPGRAPEGEKIPPWPAAPPPAEPAPGAAPVVKGL